jgi:flagellar hook-associated protein 1 FlgK
MSTIQSLLHVGASGLRAATLGVNVTSQNATNATTPGYSRRAVIQNPVPGPPDGGGGVNAKGPQRIVDRFLEKRLLGATSASAEANARRSLSEVANFALSEGAGAIGTALDGLESSLREVATSPGDRGRRSAAIAQASTLAVAFSGAANQLSNARSEADHRIQDSVGQVNRLSAEIDRLQREIRKSEVDGVEASDLRDQRDARIRELSNLVPTSVHEGPNGSLAVLLGGGHALVHAEGGTSAMSAATDPATGHVVVRMRSAGLDDDVTGTLDSGSIAGFLHARDGVLADAQTDLDELAFEVANALNAVHVAGFGLDGASGRNLFSVPLTSAGAAASLRVDPAVLNAPEALGAAQDPSLVPGDNRGLLALIDVFSTAVAAGGTETPNGALASLVGRTGVSVERADADVGYAEATFSQVSTLRDAVSGTSSDDEMVALMSYQRAYEASLRVVQAADDMLARLIDLGR